jgi:glutamate racemase
MKIGIFDSGLGGLIVLKELRTKLRNFDYVYLGDTKNLPYGHKSQKQIFDLTKKAVEYLFQQDCALVVIACNTASSQALRKIQQEWLPQLKYRDRKVLGIIRPTVENTVIRDSMTVGLIGTKRTVDSFAYSHELAKVKAKTKLFAQTTPKLVPMIERGKLDTQILKNYLQPLQAKKIDALILACTHYGIIKDEIKKILGPRVKVVAQEDLLPGKLLSYLKRHPEISSQLSKHGKIDLQITKSNPLYPKLAKQWFGNNAKLKIVKY